MHAVRAMLGRGVVCVAAMACLAAVGHCASEANPAGGMTGLHRFSPAQADAPPHVVPEEIAVAEEEPRAPASGPAVDGWVRALARLVWIEMQLGLNRIALELTRWRIAGLERQMESLGRDP